MNQPAFPPCSALQATARVVEQEQMARNTYRLRLHCPEIAQRIVPGQFFMVRPARGNDPLLGRPFALFDTYDDEHRQPAGFDFGYVTVGKLTGLMPSWKVGDEVSVWGPLGNGFPVVSEGTKHLMCVAGGIGQTPFLAVARELLTSRRYGMPNRARPIISRGWINSRSTDSTCGWRRTTAAEVITDSSPSCSSSRWPLIVRRT